MKSYHVCECGAAAAADGAADAEAQGTEVLLKVHRRRRLPQRPAYLGGLLRSRRRQAAEARRPRHQAAADHGPRERRRSRRRRPRRQGRQGRATAGSSIRGSAAANARSASAATSSFAARRSASACSAHGGYADHLLVPHPRYLFDIGNVAAGTGGAARLLGHHHLRRVEEGRPACCEQSRSSSSAPAGSA